MSRFAGATRQLGNIVTNIDEAIAYWTQTMGAGPFFVVREIRFENFRYRGEVSPSPLVTLAFGQSGPLQIELIEQHDDKPSGYLDFLNSGREGSQHLAYWFDDTGAYDATYAILVAEGLSVRQESVGPGPRFAYFSRGDGLYPEIELAEALLPSQNGWFDAIAQASIGWDGTDPVRAPDGSPDRGVTGQ